MPPSSQSRRDRYRVALLREAVAAATAAFVVCADVLSSASAVEAVPAASVRDLQLVRTR